MHLPHEELQADDSVDDDDEEHQQGDMQQGDHGLDDGIQNHLETYKDKSQTVAMMRTPASMHRPACCPACHADTVARSHPTFLATTPVVYHEPPLKGKKLTEQESTSGLA